MALNVHCTQMPTVKVNVLNVTVAVRQTDKDCEKNESENLERGKKAREMPTQASVSEHLIVQQDPFLRACQRKSEQMPIITPNNVPQQYFNDAPFVEKPLSSQELIGF